MAQQFTPDSTIAVPGEVFLVGGAVRDAFLQRNQYDRDWVVVGASEREMLAAGFSRVGTAFPVFLHPHSHEQYALARTEKKTGPGHRGFDVEANPSIALEEDLSRRDLTINAMARDKDGTLIDPHEGLSDLRSRVLRHVSGAFCEDPLRCFRVARFAAELRGFTVAPETLELLTTMCAELHELTAERVWHEYSKALATSGAACFYAVVLKAQLEKPWFDGLDLTALVQLHQQKTLEFSQAIAAIGWTQNASAASAHIQRLKAPARYQALVNNVAHDGGRLLQILRAQRPAEILELMQRVGAFRAPNNWPYFINAVQACSGEDLTDVAAWVKELSQLRVGGEPEGPNYGRLLAEQRVARVTELLANRANLA